MSSEKVAIVTGSSTGIGYTIVKNLCEKFDGTVYLTSRDVNKGKAALTALGELGFNPVFHQLDINDQNSVNNLGEHIKETHGGIDILVNNAGIAFKPDATEPLALQAEVTIKTNYFGTLRLCEALFPLLKNDANVINISNLMGAVQVFPLSKWETKFCDPNLTVDGLNQLMYKFIDDAKNNIHDKQGFSSWFSIAKFGVSALSIIQQRNFKTEQPNRNISVDHIQPGGIRHKMSTILN